MPIAFTKQKFQDWFTQQWVILWGRKIEPVDFPWLTGPFGQLNGIGEKFIHQLAEKEHLLVERNATSGGLVSSIKALNLSEEQCTLLSRQVIDFYENTVAYQLHLTIKWNFLFKVLGGMVNQLFSSRINQLNIPTSQMENNEPIVSEIITLRDPHSKRIKYTIWLRTIKSTNQVIYSGVYGTCTLPSGLTCIKAVFPLPKGNATVILKPEVGPNGELVLESSGKTFGDPGFYFLLNDAKGNYWSQFIGSFRDRLIVRAENNGIAAEQTLTLWNKKVLTCNYRINKIDRPDVRLS